MKQMKEKMMDTSIILMKISIWFGIIVLFGWLVVTGPFDWFVNVNPSRGMSGFFKTVGAFIMIPIVILANAMMESEF